MSSSIMYYSGIIMTNGFSIAGQKPADLKSVVGTIEQRDAFITNNLGYEGMIVYVKETQKTYQYTPTGWREFGTGSGTNTPTTGVVAINLYDGLDSDSSENALTAKQGKVLNDKITNHINNTTFHITDEERQAWNNTIATLADLVQKVQTLENKLQSAVFYGE